VSFEPGLPDERVNVTATSPLRDAAVLIGGLAGVVAALALTGALLVDQLVPRLPPSAETRVFGGVWLPGGAADGDAPAAPGTQALQDIVNRLERHWPENPYELRVAIWQDFSPNAFALPGGWIAVTSGLLDLVRSENELAFVLGHEIGHFRNRDHLRGLGRGVAMGIVLAAVGVSGAGAAVSVATLAGQLAQRGFDRDQETDADQFGLALLATEYGHVGGAARFFASTPHREDPLETPLSTYLSTHPLSDERIAAVARFARENGYRVNGALLPLPAALSDPPADGEDGES